MLFSILPSFLFFLFSFFWWPVGGGGMPVYSPHPISWQASAARCKSLCAGRYTIPFLDPMKRKTEKLCLYQNQGRAIGWAGHNLPCIAVVMRQAFPVQSWQSWRCPGNCQVGSQRGKSTGQSWITVLAVMQTKCNHWTLLLQAHSLSQGDCPPP